ncbi:VENN motif pre-toxin domain-containing protein [Rahnella sp. AN3-3W3]|uniref:VENN motif pre-toxin domain-containing protein n=1 Tax=Rahnella sp. AN3-3W3 TaxID=1610578 RepID=UPI003513B110
MRGAQVSGEQITAEIGRNLTAESLQDTEHYDSKQQSAAAGGSFTWGGGGGSGYISLTQDKMNADYASVTDQSGIFAGNGGFDITVGNHTQLNGGVIASGATSDKNRLDTGTLGWNDIRNKADYSVESSSASMSSSGNTASQFMGNMANGMLAGLNNDGSAASTTGSAVADGTIVIRDKEKQTQDVAELSRDTDNAHSTLAPIFDAAKEQQRIDENRAIAQIGSQVADIVRTEGKIAAQEAAKNPDNLAAAKAALEAEGKTPTGEDIARRAYDTALNDYGTGSDKQKAVQAITAAIQGLTGGDWGSAVAGSAAPYMAEYIKTHTAEGAERIISHALAGAVVADMQGGNAAAGAAGAGLSAAGAKYIAEALYPGKDIKDLSEQEKQGVVALATLASGIAGGVVGGDVSSGIDGGKGGKNEVENNALSSLGDVFGSQGGKYFEGAASLEKELLHDPNLTDQEKQTIRDQYIKGDLPEDVIKAILENNPGSDTVMALLNAKNPEDYALALLSSLPAERALALIGKMTKGAQVTGVFNIADRVYAQLNDPRLGNLSGKLNAAELQKLANNPAAVRVYDARSGHINVIQSVDGKLLRITVPNNEMKIISVGPIRPNQVKNLIEKGSFVPLP